jgi:folate-binding protein YgfZ
LDVRSTEIAALFRGAAVHDLGWLRRIRVHGDDRFRWLSGMITNIVNDLQAQTGAWNLVLNAQGRIQGDLTVWRASSDTADSLAVGAGKPEDILEVELAADQLDKLLSHLDRFIIMDDVELSMREGDTALGLTGPEAGAVLARLGLPRLEPMTQIRTQFNGMGLRIRREYGVLAEHYEIWTQSATVSKMWKFLITGGAVPVGSQAIESLRIAEGIPACGIDIVERDLPQETSQMRALHFSKGCYLGQEIVERIRSRGAVHRHLRQVEFDGPLPVPGTELTLDGNAIGNVTSATDVDLGEGARRIGLAMVKAEAEVRSAPLQYTAAEGQATARLLNEPPTF